VDARLPFRITAVLIGVVVPPRCCAGAWAGGRARHAARGGINGEPGGHRITLIAAMLLNRAKDG